MNWYKKAQEHFPFWFKEEIATEMENIHMAISYASQNPSQEFLGVSLKELKQAESLLYSDPIEYFRSETFRHNYMCAMLWGQKGYEQHCKLGEIYNKIYKKIEKWKEKQKIA